MMCASVCRTHCAAAGPTAPNWKHINRFLTCGSGPTSGPWAFILYVYIFCERVTWPVQVPRSCMRHVLLWRRPLLTRRARLHYVWPPAPVLFKKRSTLPQVRLEANRHDQPARLTWPLPPLSVWLLIGCGSCSLCEEPLSETGSRTGT